MSSAPNASGEGQNAELKALLNHPYIKHLREINRMYSNYPTRKLGKSGVNVSASVLLLHCSDNVVGFGAMGMSAFYGPTKAEEENFNVLTRAADMGVRFWDTADVYGNGRNEGNYLSISQLMEEMIGKWFKKTGRRNEIVLATKFANTLDEKFDVRGDPEYVKQACADSLKRLGIPQIDLYYLHRLSHMRVL
jgi:aryl-alcohol dehydrogenase-like predicted oxidoreductase